MATPVARARRMETRNRPVSLEICCSETTSAANETITAVAARIKVQLMSRSYRGHGHRFPKNVRGLNTAGAPRPVVSRSCSLRSRAARATAPFGRYRVVPPVRPAAKAAVVVS